MAYIRVIHKNHYDARKGRFTSVAFSPSSSNGGVSVIGANCVHESGRTYCAHVHEFYSIVAGTPAIFIKLNQNDIPDGCQFVSTPTDDPCHFDIMGFEKNQAKRFARALFKNTPLNMFRICSDEDGERELRIEDLD